MGGGERPLAGKAALITESAKNIGRATALALAADGADVLVHGRGDADAAEATAAEIRALGARAAVCLKDITDDDAAGTLVAAAREAFGRLDIVVCNAAMRRQHPFLEIPLEEFHAVMRMDLESPFRLLQEAIPLILESNKDTGYGGRAVTLGGPTPHTPVPYRAHVAAAKMGLLALTRSIAAEFGPQGLTANMVAPGHIDTERGSAAGERSGGGKDRMIERFGKPEEIAGMIRHLCRPEAAYVTGQCLHVDGGIFLGI